MPGSDGGGAAGSLNGPAAEGRALEGGYSLAVTFGVLSAPLFHNVNEKVSPIFGGAQATCAAGCSIESVDAEFGDYVER